MRYNKEYYQENKYAIFCKTGEEAEQCKNIEKCLYIPSGNFPEGFYMYFDGEWSGGKWCVENGYKIITAEEFLTGKKDYLYELY